MEIKPGLTAFAGRRSSSGCVLANSWKIPESPQRLEKKEARNRDQTLLTNKPTGGDDGKCRPYYIQ
jgi:hypothetical protein